MAKFSGTIDEFHKYLGPRFRNIVNIISKKERNSRNGICEHCKNKAELESAHIKGMERKFIIDKTLKHSYNISKGVDLEEIEGEVINSHYPIENTFIFLCKRCHTKYDSENKTNNEIQSLSDNSTMENVDLIEKEIDKVKRKVPVWLKRHKQINSKILYAFLSLRNVQKTIPIEVLKNKCNMNGNKFETNFNQMTTISKKNHGKVFVISNGTVELWSEVKDFVLKEYEKSQNQ
jgi:hypothetical protein